MTTYIQPGILRRVSRVVSLRGAMFMAVVAVLQTTAPNHASADEPRAATPTIGAQARAGQIDGLTVDIKVEGPAAQQTPLQVACVFEYVEGDTVNPPALPAAVNGILHLDQALHGLITEVRKSGKFEGHALETLLITPPKGAIAADRLLLIGLGDRRQFVPEVMRRVGAVEMREALRLGVRALSHASDLKDAGIDSPTAEIASNVIAGALAALRTQRYVAAKTSAAPPTVQSLTLLAGPAFFQETTAAATALLSHPPE